jgi:hypothetical protein
LTSLIWKANFENQPILIKYRKPSVFNDGFSFSSDNYILSCVFAYHVFLYKFHYPTF